MENQWLLALKIAPEEYNAQKNRFLVVRSTEIFTVTTMFFSEDTSKLAAEVTTDGVLTDFDFTATLVDQFPLNEFVTVTCYQMYDTFLEKYVIRIRANGTLIGTKEWNQPPPQQYTNVEVYITGKSSDVPPKALISNPFLLQLP